MKKKAKEIAAEILDYAEDDKISIIQIGNSISAKEERDRLRKGMKNLRREIKNLNILRKRNKEEIKRLRAESFALSGQTTIMESIKTENEELKQKLSEAEKELEVRRERDNRFELMDL